MSTEFEQLHVHAVYETISSDFARTRHTPWLFVERFLAGLPAGSIVLDAGCGNGKYLGCSSVLAASKVVECSTEPASDGKSGGAKKAEKGKEKEQQRESEAFVRQILPVGFDMSQGLLSIAAGNGHEVVRGDCFDLSCWRRGTVDHAISIATIHHFATSSRRMESIKQLIEAVTPPLPSASTSNFSPQSTILIVVWALEQDPALSGERSARRTKKGAFPVPTETLSNLSLDPVPPPPEEVEDQQDVFVTWALQKQIPRASKPPKFSSLSKAQRAAMVASTDPSLEREEPPISTTPVEEKPTFNRYYHLFRSGELAELVEGAKKELEKDAVQGDWKLEVVMLDGGEWWERENWVVKLGVRRTR